MKHNHVYTYDKFSCHLRKSFHLLCNNQLDDKCEYKLMYLCWNIDHLFLVQEDLFLDIWHNIEIHISSVVMHDLAMGMHTFLPFPYQMLCRKYDAHVTGINFYMFHIYEFAFPPDLLFENFAFDT